MKGEGEGDNRGLDGWMSSLTQWAWVWVNSGSWWWTGRPGVLQSIGSQRVRHDWATELNWISLAFNTFKVHLQIKPWLETWKWKKICKSCCEWITAKIIVENLVLRKIWKIEKTEQTRETQKSRGKRWKRRT